MPSADRSYSNPTTRALFALSRGYCYRPGCRNPVIEMEGKFPIVTVDIAHIRAAKKNGPRWDGDMAPDQRKAFSNLLLLCNKDHKVIDLPPHCNDYSVEKLEEWKTAREGSTSRELRSLTEDDLERMLAKAVVTEITETKSKLLSAIDAVKDLGDESVLLLKVLVAETFDRPYVNLDVVASLSESLRHVPEFSDTLQESAHRLAGLKEDITQILYRLPSDLQSFTGHVSMLSDSLGDVRKIPDYAKALKDATEPLHELPNSISILQQSVDAIHNIPDRVDSLREATEPLRGLPDCISTLQQSADVIQNLADHTENLREAAEPLRGLPESALVIQRSTEALATSHEQVQQLLASLRSLDTTRVVNPALLTKITAASSQLSVASESLAGSITKIEHAAELALQATRMRTPDRLTYVLWGIAIGAAIVIGAVVSGIWP